MEFRVLGPVEVWRQGQRLPPFAQKPTSLLVAGLVDAGQVVTVERLVDAVWGEDPPATAAKLVQSYVARLRRVLHQPGTPEIVVTRPRGYLFQPQKAHLDLHQFLALLERGRAQAGKGEHTAAAETLAASLDLWRGPALGSPTTPVLQVEAARLEELRLNALEQMLRARLEAGGGAELVGELTRLVAAHPLREQLRGLLMRALDRCGRRADALRAYRDGHRLLRTELGIEPSRELKDLHARLLAADGPAADGTDGAGQRAHPLRQLPVTNQRIPPPAQLPSAPNHLTGRGVEAGRLARALLDADSPGRVCAIHGMAGVGKTALALQVAHQVATVFPDGQLYANLSGADPGQAADPGEVIAGFLRALGVRPRRIPAALPERTAYYRTLLSRRRVLVVLDDAAGDRQAQPLLPGSGSGSCVIVTGRHPLPGLNPHVRIGLDVLDPDSAVELLARLVGADRVAAEPAAAAEITRLSGSLPLALRIVGSRLSMRSRWPLRSLADRLRSEHHRLDEMAYGDLDVRASITISYQALSGPERRALRLLGMTNAPDFAPWIVAPLLDVGVPKAQQLVERLADVHLLEPLGADGTGQVRYRFHDLVQLYARERAEHEESMGDRRKAAGRLLRTWLALIGRASTLEPTGIVHLTPGADTADGPAPTVAATLLHHPRAWLEAEHASLVAGVGLACRLGLDKEACALTSALVQASFRVNNQFDQWWRTHETALTTAKNAGNLHGEAVLLVGLGQLRYEQDRFADANHYFREALATFRRLGDIAGQATALSGIAVASREQGHFAEAMACLEQALPRFRRLHDAVGVAQVCYDIGFIHREQGRFDEATDHLHTALEIYRSLGSRRGQALTLRSLGLVHRAGGDLTAAEETCSAALRLLQETDDQLMVAYAVQALAKAHFRQRPGTAQAPALLDALRVCQKLDDSFGEALMLRTLGELYLSAGALGKAAAYLEQALDRWTQLSLPVFRARTLRDQALLHEKLGDSITAHALRQEALETFQLYGTRERTEIRTTNTGTRQTTESH
ncbi:BTAD domain-containing putative transcriptional regulator [Streptomyces sp. YIM B13518]|uniref:AfsR/SARP family transcriptional regulator n=1 Tax=Streptomyces sp. YIM B13518 TaxID=3366316 RepID=UPI0036ACDB7E